MLGFQRAEQGVVLQPVRLLVAELFISRSQVGARPVAEVFPGRFEQPLFEGNDRIVVDGCCGKGVALTVALLQQSILDQ